MCIEEGCDQRRTLSFPVKGPYAAGPCPIRAGKFAIDFTLKAQELAGNGHAFYLPIVRDTYCDTADPDVSTAYNGVVFAFTKTDDGLKLGLANGEKTGDDRMSQNGWPA